MLTMEQLDGVAAAFSVLGRFHREAPDEQTLTTFWELLDEWPLDGGEPVRRERAELALARESGETAGQIRRDHAYLYGHTAVARVAPYESVHRGLEGLVFDDQTMEVRSAYRDLGLRAPRLNKEPDDHIGLEFDFIAQASLRALDCLDDGDHAGAQRDVDVGRTFLREHLERWAPEMLASVVAEARTHFMRGIAHLSLGALETYGALVGDD